MSVSMYRLEVLHDGKWIGYASNVDYAGDLLLREISLHYNNLPRPDMKTLRQIPGGNDARFWFSEEGWNAFGAPSYHSLLDYLGRDRVRLRMRTLRPGHHVVWQDPYQFAVVI